MNFNFLIIAFLGIGLINAGIIVIGTFRGLLALVTLSGFVITGIVFSIYSIVKGGWYSLVALVISFFVWRIINKTIIAKTINTISGGGRKSRDGIVNNIRYGLNTESELMKLAGEDGVEALATLDKWFPRIERGIRDYFGYFPDTRVVTIPDVGWRVTITSYRNNPQEWVMVYLRWEFPSGGPGGGWLNLQLQFSADYGDIHQEELATNLSHHVFLKVRPPSIEAHVVDQPHFVNWTLFDHENEIPG